MNRPSDIDAELAAWVEQGPSGGPDRVLSEALAHALSTHQDHGWLDRLTQPQRYQPMYAALKIAAVAVLALAVVIVIDPLRPPAEFGAGDPTPSPSVASSPSPAPVLMGGADGSLAAGTYSSCMWDCAGNWTVTVPDGWEDFYGILWSDLGVPGTNEDVGGPGEVAFGWEADPANVFTDPCHWKDSLADPPIGPSVDDLATAFAPGAGRDVAGPTDVIFGGYRAKRVELSMPADLDLATCDQGTYRDLWYPGDSLVVPEASGAPDLGRLFTVLYIVDIDGTRYLMHTWHRADSSEEDLAELEAMLASIRIDMPAPEGSASPGPLAWSPASVEQDWPAPVRTELAGDPIVVPVDSPLARSSDPAGDNGSSMLPWADIVRLSSVSSDHMYVELAEHVPTPVADPAERWMAYGLVLDTDDDGVADVRLGIDNMPGAEGRRLHRAWRTDLHTGRTESKAGGPHGAVGDSYFDTFYPGEPLPHGPEGSARFGLQEGPTFRFYAWSSVIEDGRVVATDYAPDSGWFVAAPSS